MACFAATDAACHLSANFWAAGELSPSACIASEADSAAVSQYFSASVSLSLLPAAEAASQTTDELEHTKVEAKEPQTSFAQAVSDVERKEAEEQSFTESTQDAIGQDPRSFVANLFEGL